MGQFMGYQSYDLRIFCETCGEEWSADADDAHYCPAEESAEDEDFEESEGESKGE